MDVKVQPVNACILYYAPFEVFNRQFELPVSRIFVDILFIYDQLLQAYLLESFYLPAGEFTWLLTSQFQFGKGE